MSATGELETEFEIEMDHIEGIDLRFVMFMTDPEYITESNHPLDAETELSPTERLHPTNTQSECHDQMLYNKCT